MHGHSTPLMTNAFKGKPRCWLFRLFVCLFSYSGWDMGNVFTAHFMQMGWLFGG